MNCIVEMRVRTLRCATMTAPLFDHRLVAAGMVAMPVGVDHEADRIGIDGGDGGGDLSLSGAFDRRR